jgi:hypothetical protein
MTGELSKFRQRAAREAPPPAIQRARMICTMKAATTHVYSTSDLSWKKCPDGWALYCVGLSRPVLYVVPDQTYSKMWRIKHPDGGLSDMANLTWVRDGALTVALRVLNGRSSLPKRGRYTGARGTVQRFEPANLSGRRVANRGTAA